MKYLFLVICLAIKAADVADAAEWNYVRKGNYGPGDWGSHFSTCNGDRQSPINIMKQSVIFEPNLPDLILNNYNLDTTNSHYELKNNGHSLVVTPKLSDASEMPNITYGSDDYELLQFHFHWGINDTRGSEHTIDNKEYPAEVHFVHWNKKYNNVSEALKHVDGLLVSGFLIDIGEENAHYQKFVDKIPDVLYKDDNVSIPYFKVSDLMPSNTASYFTYNGSLTTPGCNEIVTWIVNQSPLKMSSSQIQKFRTMYEGKNNASNALYDTFRPPQALKGRTVKSNVEVADDFNFLEPAEWDYSESMSDMFGIHKWGMNFPICDDQRSNSRQSPIDIITQSVEYDGSLSAIQLSKYDTADAAKSYEMLNDGHTIKVSLPAGINPELMYAGNTYELVQFHFHWGENSERGSEHLLDGRGFQGEIHFVHFNKMYNTFQNSSKKSDGLLVHGFFIQAVVNGTNNTAFQKLFDYFSDVKHKDQNKMFSYFPVNELLPINATEYYTYDGSLTVPKCYESVKWIVNSKHIEISQSQMSLFSDIYKTKSGVSPSKKLMNTHRTVQNLNNRVVKSNIPQSTTTTTTPKPSASIPSKVICFSTIMSALIAFFAL